MWLLLQGAIKEQQPNEIWQMKSIKLLNGFLFVILLCSCVVNGNPSSNSREDVPTFGTNEDIDYAEKIWNIMEVERLAGENEVKLEPFFGGAPPHGMVLELVYRNIFVNNHDGFIVVKKNYDGVDATVESVTRNRSKYLSSITIMYQRESGYDKENQDWFWAKYNPNGSLFQKEVEGKITQMAGRIWKGKTIDQNRGCLYCHRSAGGGDYIFYPDIKIPNEKL
jgi:hypothetical protein